MAVAVPLHFHNIYQAIGRVVLHLIIKAGESVLERSHLLIDTRCDGSRPDQFGQILCHIDQLLHHRVLCLLERLREPGHCVACVINKVDHASCGLAGQQHDQLFHCLRTGLIPRLILAQVGPQFLRFLERQLGIGGNLLKKGDVK